MAMRGWRHPVRALDAWWFRVSPNRRLDRNAGNLCMLIGLMFPTASIMIRGPVPGSTLEHLMPAWLQAWMCASIFLGCGIKLHGVVAGSRWYLPKMPLKRCYTFGYIGAPFATSGLLVYGYFLMSTTPNWVAALSAILTPMLGIGISAQAFLYWLEYRRIEHNEKNMIELAKAKVRLANDADAMD